METLTEETLGACSSGRTAVALAYVERARIGAPGSRSEATFLTLRIERTICGTSPPIVEVWRYTSKGDTLLAEGRRYVVAIARRGGPVPYALGNFVAVPDGRESEAVEAHLAILQKLGTGRP